MKHTIIQKYTSTVSFFVHSYDMVAFGNAFSCLKQTFMYMHKTEVGKNSSLKII